jgi:hypothetical protein
MCDEYSRYGGGTNSAVATLSGTFTGLLGALTGGASNLIPGLSSSPDTKALDNIKADFEDVKTAWNKILDEEKNTLSEKQQEFYHDQLKFITKMEMLQSQINANNITSNKIAIIVIFAILVVIIIYLAVL